MEVGGNDSLVYWDLGVGGEGGFGRGEGGLGEA